MITNVGKLDRFVRAAIGALLFYVAFFGGVAFFAEPQFKYSAAAVGLVLLATSALKLCPLYSVFGLKTCREC